jgi:hypothetical protein
MFDLKKILILLSLGVLVAAAGTTSALAQSASNPDKEEKTQSASASEPKVVKARQAGVWDVGIAPDRNTVRLSNTEGDPLPVKVIGGGNTATRKPFQFRMFTGPTSTGQQTNHMSIPVGKRLVIENISVIARTPPGLRMAIQLFSYFDADGNGQGDSADITFHRIPLIDQGTFGEFAIATANLKVLIFADERIGANAGFGISIQGQLSGSTTEFTQGQVTLSGYIEDLPQQQ